MTTVRKDQDLIKSYLDGNNESFEILLKKYNQRVFAFIMSKVGDQSLADDIFQETFIKVINTLQLGKYNEEGKFLPWVLRIAHNLVIDHFRKVSKYRHVYDGDGEDDYSIFNFLPAEKSVEENMVNESSLKELKLLLKELPIEQYEVVYMRLYQQMSFKEISEETGVSINTALGRMRYALLNLRKLIDEKDLNFSLI